MRGVALCGVLAAALLSGCAERDRSNPLDPKNQATGGLIAGFNALAGNGQVEIRWTRLTQQGVLGYQVLRARPGGASSYLPGFLGASFAGTVDSTAENDSTYVYRLVAFLSSGDSALSPPDTATPGSRRIAALSAAVPALVRLTPDARDLLFVQPASEAYEDMELDPVREVLWLTLPDAGLVLRRNFDGTTAGVTLSLPSPSDVSISSLRGVGWVAVPDLQQAQAFGPDLDNPVPLHTISSLGEARVVEVGASQPVVWIGNEDGIVRLFSADAILLGEWNVGARVVAIALDEDRARAWVVTRLLSGDELQLIDDGDSTVTLKRTGLSNVADLAFDPVTRSLWISERGPPRLGVGRLTRSSEEGLIEVSLQGIEPFGISPDPQSGSCWVSELKSNRLIEVSPGGLILRWSGRVEVPYAVRLTRGPGIP